MTRTEDREGGKGKDGRSERNNEKESGKRYSVL
jgi:hypothetical protein